jgi:carbamate kinase
VSIDTPAAFFPAGPSPPAAKAVSGVEAVIDKDGASEFLARDLGADAYVMATDTDGVYKDWGAPS